jgi:hypothetical protein
MLMMVGATFKKFPSVQTKQEKNKMMVKTTFKSFLQKSRKSRFRKIFDNYNYFLDLKRIN